MCVHVFAHVIDQRPNIWRMHRQWKGRLQPPSALSLNHFAHPPGLQAPPCAPWGCCLCAGACASSILACAQPPPRLPDSRLFLTLCLQPHAVLPPYFFASVPPAYMPPPPMFPTMLPALVPAPSPHSLLEQQVCMVALVQKMHTRLCICAYTPMSLTSH